MEITPYATRTAQPARTAAPTPTPQPTPTVQPTATSTPFLYKIVKGDTLGAIAGRFGVTVNDLLAANPGIDPRFLTIGKDLVIPIQGISAGQPAGEAELTLPALIIHQDLVRCWPEINPVGSICLVPVTNPLETDLEDVAATLTLFNQAGEVTGNGEAVTPIQWMPAGATLPLVFRLDQSQPEMGSVLGKITRAFPVSPEDTRYLPSRVENVSVVVSNDRRSAALNGTLYLSSTGVESIRILAVAFGLDRAIVGYRIWEQNVDSAVEGQQIPFDLVVYGYEDILTVEWVIQVTSQ